MQIFVAESVPLGKREIIRVTVGARLAPVLEDHPHFASLAVLVSCDARRGGWQVSLVALDPDLQWPGSVMPLDASVLQGLRETLARL